MDERRIGVGKYLAIPGAILLIVLVMLGARAETPDEFSARQEQQSSDSGGGTERSEPYSWPERPLVEPRYRYEPGSVHDGSIQDLEPPTRLSIGTDDGRIVIEPAGSEDSSGATWDIDPPLPGELVGYRLDDGEFAPVRQGEEQPGDVLITWDGPTLILSEVEGGRTEIHRTDDGLAGSNTEADGEFSAFDTGDHDPVIINSRIQAEPEDPGPIFGYDPSDPTDRSFASSTTWMLILLVTGIVMFSVGMWLIFKDGIGLRSVSFAVPDRRQRANAATPAQELRLFDRLRLSDDADAVVRELYERATSGAWRIERRHHEETPLEFYARVSLSLPGDAAIELRRLSDLYSAIKFAPGAATLEHRDQAIDIAERLLDQMQLTQELVTT